MFSKHMQVLCLHCGLECEVVYHTWFSKLRRKIKYCPTCGIELKYAQLNEESPIELAEDRNAQK